MHHLLAEKAGPHLPEQAHPGADDWPEVADGAYFAALWVYYGGEVVEVLPVGRLTIVDGLVRDLEPIQLGPRLLRPRSLPEVARQQTEPGWTATEMRVLALDAAERLLPILTPETLVDAAPLMERPR